MSTISSLSVVTDKDLNLIIDFSEVLGYRCFVILTPWENGVSWSSSVEGFLVEPLEELGLPFSMLISTKEAYKWFSLFPESLPQQLVQYDKKYRGTTYGLLWCISRSSNAYELFLDSPVMAWLIINSASKLQWSTEFTLGLFSAKRTEILEECGFTNSKAILNLLLKCRFEIFGSQEFNLITKFHLLTSNKHLSHLPFLDEQLLKLIVRFPTFKESNLIKQFGPSWNWNHFNQNFNDALNMGNQLDIPDILTVIFDCKDIKSLKRLHDKLVVKVNKKKCSETPLVNYKKPPILGTEHIIPITNNHALMNEGSLQRHCVASYHKRILLGHYYVYKVLEPERATLGLNLNKGKFHSIEQIKLCCNRSVSKETIEQIEAWLRMNMAALSSTS